jgi:hypothetical protein
VGRYLAERTKGVATTIRSQGDLDASQRRDRDFVGARYFYVDVRNMRADLGTPMNEGDIMDLH